MVKVGVIGLGNRFKNDMDRLDPIDNIYEFKVKDYTTNMVGRMYEACGVKIFFIQRADGTVVHQYPEHRIESYTKIR